MSDARRGCSRNSRSGCRCVFQSSDLRCTRQNGILRRFHWSVRRANGLAILVGDGLAFAIVVCQYWSISLSVKVLALPSDSLSCVVLFSASLSFSSVIVLIVTNLAVVPVPE